MHEEFQNILTGQQQITCSINASSIIFSSPSPSPASSEMLALILSSLGASNLEVFTFYKSRMKSILEIYKYACPFVFIRGLVMYNS
ncbi:unnamed protein product [Urochloa humidicola]